MNSDSQRTYHRARYQLQSLPIPAHAPDTSTLFPFVARAEQSGKRTPQLEAALLGNARRRSDAPHCAPCRLFLDLPREGAAAGALFHLARARTHSGLAPPHLPPSTNRNMHEPQLRTARPSNRRLGERSDRWSVRGTNLVTATQTERFHITSRALHIPPRIPDSPSAFAQEERTRPPDAPREEQGDVRHSAVPARGRRRRLRHLHLAPRRTLGPQLQFRTSTTTGSWRGGRAARMRSGDLVVPQRA
ncbi:hypothetical protein B0H15DRAFT_949686 [Mycena belliarum]|uniref:Uncharacterized protein n=1 Tax=Mycena belliarum TaxID=1033014 RepID=A0AAD6U2W7_9AGAR|nr:hypothetical protein B0H15DRAFT_949686 [Mycena belliae]